MKQGCGVGTIPEGMDHHILNSVKMTLNARIKYRYVRAFPLVLYVKESTWSRGVLYFT